jgi:hypothetical protein
MTPIALATETAVDVAPVVAKPDGFISSSRVAAAASPLFVSLDAAKSAGTPVYTIDSEGARTYLPPTFVGTLLSLTTIEKDYSGSYEAQTKVLARFLIANQPYVMHVGINSWAGQSLLTSLAQLTPDQLQQQLMVRITCGKRTCFCRVSTGSEAMGWQPVAIDDGLLNHKLETTELLTMAAAIHELL